MVPRRTSVHSPGSEEEVEEEVDTRVEESQKVSCPHHDGDARAATPAWRQQRRDAGRHSQRVGEEGRARDAQNGHRHPVTSSCGGPAMLLEAG